MFMMIAIASTSVLLDPWHMCAQHASNVTRTLNLEARHGSEILN
jgi:hypothetical protein